MIEEPVLSASQTPPKVELTPPPPLEKPHETPAAVWGALGAGAVGGALGVVFTMIATSKVDDERIARYSGESADEINDLRSSAKTNAAIAYGGFGVAIAGFTAAIVLDLVTE
jgi:hypothetical protein